MPTERQPWERQHGESHVAFEAFARYRDQRGRRSQARVAEGLGKSEALLNRWSRRWSWRDRVRAYDDEQDRRWREEVAAARVDLARKHASVGAAMLAKSVAAMQALRPEDIKPHDLERWLRTATEIERLAYTGGSDGDDLVATAKGVVTELVQQLRR